MSYDYQRTDHGNHRRPRRGPLDYLFVTGCALMLAGLGALAIALLIALTPDIQGAPAQHRTPATGPTTVPKPPVHLDKTTLIIQQDVDCWLGGAPGATCGMVERTYR
jgi:hypothetical protein